MIFGKRCPMKTVRIANARKRRQHAMLPSLSMDRILMIAVATAASFPQLGLPRRAMI
jgi:hypothetical protein